MTHDAVNHEAANHEAVDHEAVNHDGGDLHSFLIESTLGTPGALALGERANLCDVDYVLALRHLAASDVPPLIPLPQDVGRTEIKVLVTGGFGAGKTTMVGSATRVAPVTTETLLTSAGVGVDDIRQVPVKATTTGALDYGRAMLAEDLVVHLFGAPGQTRFWFLWDELVRGSTGVVLIVDTRRLADCFAAIDFLEQRRLPYVVAINCFDGVQYHHETDVRDALDIAEHVPVISCDARIRSSTERVLVTLVEHALRVGRSPLPVDGAGSRASYR